MRVRANELVTARELARTYSALVERLSRGELERVVITKHGKMEAVLITVDEYERLTSGEEPR